MVGMAGAPPPIGNVLVVDDDPRVRAAIGALVGSCSELQLVDAVASACEAVGCCERDGSRPDVAVVDVLLPDQDTGLRLVKSLTAAGVRVVALSARGGVRAAALAAGAVAFVEKDGAPDALLDLLLEQTR
jgi:CheY-like chemotaxis protein